MYNSHCDGIKKTIENVIIAFNTIMDFLSTYVFINIW